MKKVFLGGTCNGSEWREELIKGLEMDYFNPVVEDWTPECMDEEIRQRKECDYVLYVITAKMSGVFAIAEAVDDSNKQPEKTLFLVIERDGEEKFDKHQIKSLGQTINIVKGNGGKTFATLNAVRKFLNNNQ